MHRQKNQHFFTHKHHFKQPHKCKHEASQDGNANGGSQRRYAANFGNMVVWQPLPKRLKSWKKGILIMEDKLIPTISDLSKDKFKSVLAGVKLLQLTTTN